MYLKSKEWNEKVEGEIVVPNGPCNMHTNTQQLELKKKSL